MCCHKDVFCQTDKHIADIQTLQHYRKSGLGGRQVPRLICFQEQMVWGPRLGGGQLCRELGTAKLLFMINEEPLTHYYVEVITLNLGNTDKRKDYIFGQNQN